MYIYIYIYIYMKLCRLKDGKRTNFSIHMKMNVFSLILSSPIFGCCVTVKLCELCVAS